MAPGPSRPPPGLPQIHGVAAWKVQNVVEYLHQLELGHLSHIVKREGIDGRMLLELIDSSELMETGFSRLQVRKITQRLPPR